MTEHEIKRTLLYDSHVDLGARMSPFGGYEMPIQYSGILDEHLAARKAAAVFDTCHMGEFRIHGETAERDLEWLITCDIGSLKSGRCRYGLLCNERGGALDDLLVYKFSRDDFMLVVNAGTQERDFSWIAGRVSADTAIENLGPRTGKIDLQGPAAPAIARELFDGAIEGMVFYSFRTCTFEDAPVLVSRTGYTGEIGFEFYAAPGVTRKLWKACLEKGAKPAGLGARDTLRLEMGMPLYGHELTEERNVAEAGFGRAIAESKEFIGAEAVRARDAASRVLRGILFDGRRAAREGDVVLDAAGAREIGSVTSGSYAPALQQAAALAYVDRNQAESDRAVSVKRGRKLIPGRIVSLPFYKDGTARKKLANAMTNRN